MTIKFFPSDCSKPVAALAFDYGTQRIGVSFGQSISATAKAIAVIKAKDGIPDWDDPELNKPNDSLPAPSVLAVISMLGAAAILMPRRDA